MTREQLAAQAARAMARAYAPYSRFQVGAALLTKDGRVYLGCNIENASFGATVCAERTALFQAVSQGERDFAALAVVGGHGGVIREFTPPCGVCRQVLAEFCGPDFQVHLWDGGSRYETRLLRDLLPVGFSGKQVTQEGDTL